MPSITSWMRLEPRSRDAEMNTSLQARIYDPLWLLARQWQFGEFQGEDNGSPVISRWNGEAAPLTRYFSGAITPNTQIKAPKYDPQHAAGNARGARNSSSGSKAKISARKTPVGNRGGPTLSASAGPATNITRAAG